MPRASVTSSEHVPSSAHLVLIGMMASGKTTVGRAVAARLHRPFFDSDAMVEARTGRTVREIFETDGEAAYRPLETDALVEALASPTPAVIAAAGGVVLAEANLRRLLEQRLPLYAEVADDVVDVDGQPVDHVVAAVLAAMGD